VAGPPGPRRRPLRPGAGRPARLRGHLLRLSRAVPGAAAGGLRGRVRAAGQRPARGAAPPRDPGGGARVDRRGPRRAGQCGHRPGGDLRGDRPRRLPVHRAGGGGQAPGRHGRRVAGSARPAGLPRRPAQGPGCPARAGCRRGAEHRADHRGHGGVVPGAGAAGGRRRPRVLAAHQRGGHRAGPGRRRAGVPLVAQGRARQHHLGPAAPARRGVRGGGLRGAQARGQLVPDPDRHERDRADPGRVRRADRLDQRRRPVRLLHGRLDGDDPRRRAPGHR
jgi:hypothetical protein